MSGTGTEYPSVLRFAQEPSPIPAWKELEKPDVICDQQLRPRMFAADIQLGVNAHRQLTQIRLRIDKPTQICHTDDRRFNSHREELMSLSAHLSELSEKHRLLERKIEEAVASPGTADSEIRRLKQEKLKIKDEITRLKDNTRH